MRKRNLLIILAVLVLLIAAYIFAVNYTPAEKTEPTSAPNAESVVAFEIDSEEISKISFDNSTPFSLIKNDGVWKIEGNSAEILQASAMSISYSAAYISADTEIKNAGNLADFGLKNPEATVTIYHGEKVSKLLLGSKIPTGSYYYFKLDGDSRVYTISEYTADIFFKTPSSVRDLSVLSISAGEIEGFEISSPQNSFKLVKNTEATKEDEKSYASLKKWSVISPFTQYAAEERVREHILTPVSSITAESVAADGSGNLAQYNLDTTVNIKAADKTYSFKIGQANGVNYLYSPEKNIVYVVLKTNLSFADVKAFDVIQRLITFPNIEELKSVEVKTNNIETLLTREEKSEKETVYRINNKNCDEKLFKSTYQSIMGLSVDGVLGSYSKKDSLGTVLYTMESGAQEKIEFYASDEFNAAVVYNGKAQFYIKRTKIAELEKVLGAIK